MILPKIKLNNGVNLFSQAMMVKKKRKYLSQIFRKKRMYFQSNYSKIMHQEWSFQTLQKDGINLYFKLEITMISIYTRFWKLCKMFQKINQEILYQLSKNNNSMKISFMNWIKHAKLFQIT